MDFDKLVEFLRVQGPILGAAAIVVAPTSWAITRWLYENRIAEVSAENRRLKSSMSAPGTETAATATGGVAQGEWVDIHQTHGGTYSYRLSLTQSGMRISGTGSITRAGPNPYDQPFVVEGKEFAGCILLTLTSASAGSTSAVAALLRVMDRGTKLSGQWSYRTRAADEVAVEQVSLSRQVPS